MAPKKKPYRRRKPKRKYKKKYPIQKNMSGFPSNKIFKMRYVTSGVLDAGVGTISKVYFRANGPYDPEVAVGGHQPLGWDQITPFYNHYTVLGSKLTASFSSAGPSAQYGPSSVCGVYLSDDSVTPNTVSTIMEQGLGRWRYVAQTSQKGAAASSVTNTFSAKRFFNVTDVKDVDKLRSTIVTLPADEALFTVWTGSMDPAEDPTTFAYVVTIEYIISFSEPTSLVQS